MFSLVFLFVTVIQFWRTKVVTLQPRYHLSNRSRQTLWVKQQGLDQRPFSILPGERLPWFWPAAALKRLLRLRYHQPDCAWSGPFPLEGTSIALRMRNTAAA